MYQSLGGATDIPTAPMVQMRKTVSLEKPVTMAVVGFPILGSVMATPIALTFQMRRAAPVVLIKCHVEVMLMLIVYLLSLNVIKEMTVVIGVMNKDAFVMHSLSSCVIITPTLEINVSAVIPFVTASTIALMDQMSGSLYVLLTAMQTKHGKILKRIISFS